MRNVPLPPVELLWERYALNPFTGKFHRRSTGTPIHGHTSVRKSDGYRSVKLKICWDGHSYGVSYGRAVLAFMTGAWPIHETDHIDRDTTNNRPWNVRELTTRGNAQNRGNFGGCWVASKNRWQAQIRINGKVHWLGYYKSQAEAQAAYATALAELERS